MLRQRHMRKYFDKAIGLSQKFPDRIIHVMVKGDYEPVVISVYLAYRIRVLNSWETVAMFKNGSRYFEPFGKKNIEKSVDK